MNLLITLLIYLIAGTIIYFIVIAILGLAEASPAIVKIAKLIMLGIALIMVLILFFGGGYVEMWHFKEIK